jgi:hypothetical protein
MLIVQHRIRNVVAGATIANEWWFRRMLRWSWPYSRHWSKHSGSNSAHTFLLQLSYRSTTTCSGSYDSQYLCTLSSSIIQSSLVTLRSEKTSHGWCRSTIGTPHSHHQRTRPLATDSYMYSLKHANAIYLGLHFAMRQLSVKQRITPRVWTPSSAINSSFRGLPCPLRSTYSLLPRAPFSVGPWLRTH